MEGGQGRVRHGHVTHVGVGVEEAAVGDADESAPVKSGSLVLGVVDVHVSDPVEEAGFFVGVEAVETFEEVEAGEAEEEEGHAGGVEAGGVGRQEVQGAAEISGVLVGEEWAHGVVVGGRGGQG